MPRKLGADTKAYNLGRLEGAIEVLDDLGITWESHSAQMLKWAIEDMEMRAKSGLGMLRRGTAAFYLTDRHFIALVCEEDFYSLDVRRLVPEWRRVVEDEVGEQRSGRWFITHDGHELAQSPLGRDSAYDALHGHLLRLPKDDGADEEGFPLELVFAAMDEETGQMDEEPELRGMFMVSEERGLSMIAARDDTVLLADLVDQGFDGWLPVEREELVLQ